MAHPFLKMLETALGKSTQFDNQLITEANRLIGKGYRREEIVGLLEKMKFGRIRDEESEIVDEALEEFEGPQ